VLDTENSKARLERLEKEIAAFERWQRDAGDISAEPSNSGDCHGARGENVMRSRRVPGTHQPRHREATPAVKRNRESDPPGCGQSKRKEAVCLLLPVFFDGD
jgi:hypothetical protein